MLVGEIIENGQCPLGVIVASFISWGDTTERGLAVIYQRLLKQKECGLRGSLRKVLLVLSYSGV